jgi:hypothetical protein
VKTVPLLLIGGAVVVGGYFVYKAVSQPTDQSSDYCTGDWTDAINPLCWLGGVQDEASNTINTATNEVNTVLIILGVVLVLVIGLLAFGPQTQHIARGASALAVL